MKRLVVILSAIMAASCAHGQSAVMPAPQSPSSDIAALARDTNNNLTATLGTTWTQYPLQIRVQDLIAGHDGFLYSYGYVNGSWSVLVKMDALGNQTMVPISGMNCYGSYGSIAPNPDGNIYALEALKDGTPAVAQVTPQGAVTEFPLPYTDCTLGIVSGSDGNLWVLHTSGVGRMTTQGKYTEFGGGPFNLSYSRIQRGPDKNLWAENFNFGTNTLVRTSVQDGSQTSFVVPDDASELAEGPGGTLYMMGTGEIFQVNMDGTVTAFPLTIAKTGIPFIMGTKGRLFWVDRQRLFLYGTATHKIERRIAAPANGTIAVSADHTALWMISGNAYSLTL